MVKKAIFSDKETNLIDSQGSSLVNADSLIEIDGYISAEDGNDLTLYVSSGGNFVLDTDTTSSTVTAPPGTGIAIIGPENPTGDGSSVSLYGGGASGAYNAAGVSLVGGSCAGGGDTGNAGSVSIATGSGNATGLAGNITLYLWGASNDSFFRIKHSFVNQLSVSNGYISAETNRIEDVQDPIDPQDCATKKYVDDNASVLDGYMNVDDGYVTVTGDFAIDGKLYVSGLIDPTGMVLDAQSTVPGGTPSSGKATLWIRQSDGYLVFTDEENVTYPVAGGGPVAPEFSAISPDALDGYVVDYAPTGWSAANVARLDAVDGYDITGFDADPLVPIKKIINVSAFDLVLKHEDVRSDAANRILVPGGEDLTLEPDDVVDVFYDSVDDRWRLV